MQAAEAMCQTKAVSVVAQRQKTESRGEAEKKGAAKQAFPSCPPMVVAMVH